MKLISGNAKEDPWDHRNDDSSHKDLHKDDNFAFFDSADEGDRVFMDDEKLVVVSDSRKYSRREHDDDMLKQIFEKEFSPMVQRHEEAPPRVIQKPPRKSLESLNSKRNSSNYSSRNSMRFDD